MQQLFLFLFCQFLFTSSFGQLISHYQFEQDGRSLSLIEKMAAGNVPGFSTHLIYGEDSDSLVVGRLEKGGQQKIAHSTPFPAGAMSEAPVLFEVLRLADAGEISLDDPVEKYLLPELQDKRWFKSQPITIRDLILRRKSFGGPMKPTGYEAGEGRPELSQLLKAGSADFPRGLAARSNGKKNQQPQCANAILLELILEKHHQQPLPQIMEERVFKPLGMDHSFYATELNAEQAGAVALGHDKSGATLPGGYRRYPELAASGLWTTPADYARFVEHVILASKGKDNRFLKPATARAGLTVQTGYRSLLFHISEDGGIYWGGNTKGYFTAMQANLKDEYVMVAFCNGDLNWPLVMGALYQSGGWIAQQRSGESLGLFTQPGDEALSKRLREKLKIYAQEHHINLIEVDASLGAPVSITATPALVFQSPEGRSLFGGMATEWAALENFIRTARSRQMAPAAATPEGVLVRQEGRQTIGFPLKWTEWNGVVPTEDWQEPFLEVLEKKLGANYATTATFLPTDRRFYLDVHPYAKGDSVFLSLAVFSQFDCIQPISDNFGMPLAGAKMERTELLNRAAAFFAQAIQERLEKPQAGDALFALPGNTPIVAFEVLGLKVVERKKTIGPQPSAAAGVELPQQWGLLHALPGGQPVLQFNFPSPLERYAGEVRRLTGEMAYVPGQLSGEFVAGLRSLTMGMADLDAKVLKQYLKVRRYSTATFSFEKQAIDMYWDQKNEARINGNLNFLGEDIAIVVDARLEPRSTDGTIEVEVQFELDIARPFGLPGPDGPEFAREHLQFSLQFQLAG